MINIKELADCCGCTACESICEKSAISMTSDRMGFKYPIIDKMACIDCGLCERVCAFNSKYETLNNFEDPIAYASRQIEIYEVEKSRSGGIFAALAKYILHLNGVIYGAGFDNSLNVIHKRVDTLKNIDELRGSKYVQSHLNKTFKSAAKDLKEGKFVLFSGTPCQIAGLNSFLKFKRLDVSRLLTCDIVCHGVPSPKVWQDYLKDIENHVGGKITSANFRDKNAFGWKAHKESFVIDNKYTYTYKYSFSTIFNNNIVFRPSCGKCPFTNLRRPGDITLADFWGWEKVNPEINNDNKGISLILVNTPKGEKFFSKISDKVISIRTNIENGIQPNLQHPSQLHPRSSEFAEYYTSHGYEKALKKFGLKGWKYDLMRISNRISHQFKLNINKLKN